MYLSVQKIKGKTKIYGNYKGVVTYQEVIGTTKYYKWKYTDDKFERENISYKFIVKHSYRENGKLKQKNLVLGTYFWYDFIYTRMSIDLAPHMDKLYSIFDCTASDIDKIKKAINLKIDEIEFTEDKKYHSSKEYEISRKYKIKVEHWTTQKNYYDKYIGEGYFEQIYDFGCRVVNNELYNFCAKLELENRKKANEEWEKTQEERKRQQKEFDKEWEQYAKELTHRSSGFDDAERLHLKQFYKVLSKSYHPDLNRNKDTTIEMQLINKLKQQWNV